jgi:hypothetical protein
MQFDLGDVLTITTGRLVSRDHIDGVYRILNHMTGDNLFTHQLPRAMDECRPDLLRQHPDLAAITVPDGIDSAETCAAWLDSLEPVYGSVRDVEPLHPDDHTQIDPLAELGLRGVRKASVIPVVVGDDPQER